jgi:predicted neuraminidase
MHRKTSSSRKSFSQKLRPAWLLAVCIIASAAQPIYAEPIHKERLIFDPEVESHGHVHASSIVECPNGDLLAVWYENGPDRPEYYYRLDADKADNTRIGGARLLSGREKWEKPFVMSDTYGVSDNNPALVVDAKQRLWLVHPSLIGVPFQTWGSGLLWYKVSSDYQKPGPPRWDRESVLIVHPRGLDEVVARHANELRSGADSNNTNERRAEAMLQRLSDPFARRLGWMPRTHPLAFADGSVLVPFSNENFNVAAMALSPDGGQTWTISNAVPGVGVTQPSVVRLESGKLLAFFRSAGRSRRIQRSESTDGGMTWTEVTPTELPNPGSGVEAVMLQSGRLAMIYNDLEESPRYRLAVSISPDEGKTWPWKRYLENTPGGRFDYPSLVQAKDGVLHATYGYNLKTIKHVEFNEAWVEKGN